MGKSLLTDQRYLKAPGEWWLHRSHAVLGALVMGHLFYRYACFFAMLLVFPTPAAEQRHSWVQDMGFHGDAVRIISSPNDQHGRNNFGALLPMVLLLAPHLLLQASGFGFRIPPKRHPDGNRIWGEYRWHALAFFARCASLLCFAWYNKTQQQHEQDEEEEEQQRYFNTRICAGVIFLVNMMVVDAMIRNFARRPKQSSTTTTTTTSDQRQQQQQQQQQPEQQVGTIRGLKGSNGFKYLLSATQFHANLHCLCTQDQLSVQWAALTVVQSSAFGMTLRRKCLITHGQGLALYASVLTLGMMVIGHDWHRRGILYSSLTVGNVAALLRMDGGWNKYLLWLVIAALVVPQMEQWQHQQQGEPSISVILFVGSTMALGTSAIHRHYQQQKQQLTAKQS